MASGLLVAVVIILVAAGGYVSYKYLPNYIQKTSTPVEIFIQHLEEALKTNNLNYTNEYIARGNFNTITFLNTNESDFLLANETFAKSGLKIRIGGTEFESFDNITKMFRTFVLPDGTYYCSKYGLLVNLTIQSSSEFTDYYCKKSTQSPFPGFLDIIGASNFNPSENAKNFNDSLSKNIIINVSLLGQKTFVNRSCDNFAIEYNKTKFFESVNESFFNDSSISLDALSETVCLDKQAGFASEVTVFLSLSATLGNITLFNISLDENIQLTNHNTSVDESIFTAPPLLSPISLIPVPPVCAGGNITVSVYNYGANKINTSAITLSGTNAEGVTLLNSGSQCDPGAGLELDSYSSHQCSTLLSNATGPLSQIAVQGPINIVKRNVSCLQLPDLYSNHLAFSLLTANPSFNIFAQVNLAYNVYNNGTASAGSFTDGLTAKFITNSTSIVVGNFSTSNLGVGSNFSHLVFTWPNPPLDYYNMVHQVDVGNQVQESNENGNVVTDPLAIEYANISSYAPFTTNNGSFIAIFAGNIIAGSPNGSATLYINSPGNPSEVVNLTEGEQYISTSNLRVGLLQTFVTNTTSSAELVIANYYS